MAHTRKNKIVDILVDTKSHSLDMTIYSSGGVLHSVHCLIFDDDGIDYERWVKSFTGGNARQRAFEYTEQVKSAFLDPDSKFNQANKKP